MGGRVLCEIRRISHRQSDIGVCQKTTLEVYKLTLGEKPRAFSPRRFIFEKQLRDLLFNVSLHPNNVKYLINRLNADETKEKRSTEEKISLLKSSLLNIDQRLERLLTGFLDQVINKDEYLVAKNKLIEEKTEIEEEISNIRVGGFRWVELVREFIFSALEAHKTAREKNNWQDLYNLAKKVGSNYFLYDRSLSFIASGGFVALAAGAGAASAMLPSTKLQRVWDSNL